MTFIIHIPLTIDNNKQGCLIKNTPEFLLIEPLDFPVDQFLTYWLTPPIYYFTNHKASTMLKKLKAHIKIFMFSVLVSSFLTACSPHPATGTWLSSDANTENYSKMVVHFEPRLEIYSKNSDKPTLYCGWSGYDKDSITLECMSSENQKQMDMYQFNVTQNSQAELLHDDKVIAKFSKLE